MIFLVLGNTACFSRLTLNLTRNEFTSQNCLQIFSTKAWFVLQLLMYMSGTIVIFSHKRVGLNAITKLFVILFHFVMNLFVDSTMYLLLYVSTCIHGSINASELLNWYSSASYSHIVEVLICRQNEQFYI